MTDAEADVAEMWHAFNAEVWRTACQEALNDIGFTYQQLAEMAARNDFPSTEARKVWLVVRGEFEEGTDA